MVDIEEEVQEEEGLAVEEISALGLEDEREVEDVEDSKPLKVDDHEFKSRRRED